MLGCGAFRKETEEKRNASTGIAASWHAARRKSVLRKKHKRYTLFNFSP